MRLGDLRSRIDALTRQAPKPRAALVYYQVGEEPPDLAPGEVVVPLFGDDDPLLDEVPECEPTPDEELTR